VTPREISGGGYFAGLDLLRHALAATGSNKVMVITLSLKF
jgi:hypothetical protein